MKKTQLKELIKQSMLELKSPEYLNLMKKADDTGRGYAERDKFRSQAYDLKIGAMTPDEEKMVSDYEEEEANKFALDSEEPLEEISGDVKKLKSFLKNYVNNEIQDPNSPYVHIEWFSESNMKARNLEQLLKSLDVEYKYETETDGGFKVHMFDINKEQANKATLVSKEPLDENMDDMPEDIEWIWDGEVYDRVDYHSGDIGLEGYSKSTGRDYTASVMADYNGDDWDWSFSNIENIEVVPVKEIKNKPTHLRERKEPLSKLIRKADRIVESWNYKKKSLLTEGADLSTQVTNWKELDRYGEEILVITADGKKEKFTLSDIDESELSYEYNFDDTKAYLTYHNADKSKTLGMTSHITGSPDSPEGYDELELDYLTDNTGKLSEGMHGGYIELMEMNPKFDEGLEMVLEVWNEWKSGQMTEPEMIDEAREDLLSYLSSVLR